MLKQKTFFLIAILMTSGLLLFNMTEVNGWHAVNGDPNREIETDLQFAFPNGTLFMYNYTSNMLVYSIDYTNNTSDLVDNIDYSYLELDNVFYTEVDATHVNLTVNTFSNNTNDTTLCPIQLLEWTYDDTLDYEINNTLISLVENGLYFPDDVFLDDLFLEDDSYIESTFIGSLMANLDSMIVIDGSVSSNVSNVDLIDNFNGIYENQFEIEGDYISNEFMGLEVTNATITITADSEVNISMNCYHVLDYTSFQTNLTMIVTNNTNTSEYWYLSMVIGMTYELLCSTLLDCDAGYELFGDETGQGVFNFFADNWYWFLILLASVAVTLLVAFFIQRSSCDKVSNPADHLACRIGNKYVQK